MNSRSGKCCWAVEVWYWLWLAFGLLSLSCASLLTAEDQYAAPDVTVHEWGTFTASAGNDGRAVLWQTSRGATDLPGFVDHFSTANFESGLPAHSEWRKYISRTMASSRIFCG